MYSFSSKKVPSAQSISGQREMVSAGLPWERKGNCKDLIGDNSYQKKKKKLNRQLLETRACEDPLAQGKECTQQSSLEVKRVLQQKAKGEEHDLQDGDLLGHKERLDSGSWRLDFESESVHEEIYWGCFYFFPWLRMCRRDKREQL